MILRALPELDKWNQCVTVQWPHAHLLIMSFGLFLHSMNAYNVLS